MVAVLHRKDWSRQGEINENLVSSPSVLLRVGFGSCERRVLSRVGPAFWTPGIILVGLQKFPATDRQSAENGLMAQTPTGQTRLSGQAKPEVGR